MKLSYAVCLVLALVALTGTAKASPKGSGQISGQLSAKISGKTRGGDSSAGGGNTINGYVLEKYQKATPQLDGWPNGDKKIQLIRADIPPFAEVIEARAKELRWYILPIKLENLPAEITGIGIATDQTAIQLNQEVYVDENQWKTLKPDQKTDLILHEIVLAEYLHLKRDPSPKYPLVTELLSMTDMRKVSDLVLTYTHDNEDSLTQTLYDQNFGYYLSKNKEKKIVDYTTDTLKTSLGLYCAPGEKPKLSQLTQTVFELLYLQFRTCEAFPDSCWPNVPADNLEMQRFADAEWTLEFSYLPSWVALGEIFPKELMNTTLPDKTGSPPLFESVYPDRLNTPWDFEMGAKACKAFQSFDFKKLHMKWEFARKS